MSDTGKSDLPEDEDSNLEADLEAEATRILKEAEEAAEREETGEEEPQSSFGDIRSFAEAIDGTGLDDDEVGKTLIDNILGDREKLEEEVADLKDKLLRAMAEEQNLRRRMARELEDASKYAVTNLARDMLAVGDNLKRALDHMTEETGATDEDAATFRAGVELTARELQSVLDRHGIKTIEPLGEKFDHNLHQAMFEVPDSGEADGTIVQVIAAGYTIGDRLLRAAMVGVAKGGNVSSTAEAGSEEEISDD